MPFGRQEVTVNIASAATLYKKLITSTEGYVGEAPINQQAVALKAAIDVMDTAFAEDREFLAGEWPDDPSFRFLVHRALRRELCDPGICPDAPEGDGECCGLCPIDMLDAAQNSEKGLVLRRVLDLMSALKLFVHVGLDEIRADEFCARLIITEERDLLEREKLPGAEGRYPRWSLRSRTGEASLQRLGVSRQSDRRSTQAPF